MRLWNHGSDLELGAAWLVAGIAPLAPVGLLVGGFQLRRRERRALAVLRVIEHQLVVAAEDLMHAFELGRAELALAIRDLNSSGLAFLVWDRQTNRVQDGRLRRTVLQVEKCGACGAKIAQEISIAHAASAARCPHCGSGLPVDDVADARERVVAEIQRKNRLEQMKTSNAEQPTFSMTIFVVLMLIAWPLALIYMMRRWKMTS